ncbi:hypothetical protein NLJ89_g8785 [Agrocybe chaxingu]|uniref:Tc1-like transposase DDE domain-containing protein n=1 Tax=Agrocybe chaxingu TaxID=84603 RepID=A0A9W8JUS2_9AGAR|nr:hypothetical protein NLJ89_g8785 [Agrocybe chaxingu]
MVNRRISADVKLAAIKLYERRLLALEDILDCVGFSQWTFWRTLKRYRETGTVVPQPSHLRGRPRKLHFSDVSYLFSLLHHRPDWFLDEFLDLLESNRFISVHYTTIYRELKRMGVSRKKLRRIAKERNEDLRADYIRTISQYSPEELGFIDEFSKDERTLQRRCGRAVKGRRAVMRGVFVRGRRISGEGLLTLDGIVASTVVEGSMTHEKYLRFLEHNVMPLTTPYPGKLSVLVMDNARIHHGEGILELAQRFGVRIIFLPPYSPDLNPIEEAISKIKAWIRRNYDLFTSDHGILYDIKVAMDVITPNDAAGYFIDGGYF